MTCRYLKSADLSMSYKLLLIAGSFVLWLDNVMKTRKKRLVKYMIWQESLIGSRDINFPCVHCSISLLPSSKLNSKMDKKIASHKTRITSWRNMCSLELNNHEFWLTHGNFFILPSLDLTPLLDWQFFTRNQVGIGTVRTYFWCILGPVYLCPSFTAPLLCWLLVIGCPIL